MIVHERAIAYDSLPDEELVINEERELAVRDRVESVRGGSVVVGFSSMSSCLVI